MKWYKVGIKTSSKPCRTVELQAHDTGDAVTCACVKLKAAKDPTVDVVELECIEEPGWARAAIAAAAKAVEP